MRPAQAEQRAASCCEQHGRGRQRSPPGRRFDAVELGQPGPAGRDEESRSSSSATTRISRSCSRSGFVQGDVLITPSASRLPGPGGPAFASKWCTWRRCLLIVAGEGGFARRLPAVAEDWLSAAASDALNSASVAK